MHRTDPPFRIQTKKKTQPKLRRNLGFRAPDSDSSADSEKHKEHRMILKKGVSRDAAWWVSGSPKLPTGRGLRRLWGVQALDPMAARRSGLRHLPELCFCGTRTTDKAQHRTWPCTRL